MPFLTIDEFVNEYRRKTYNDNSREAMVDFLERIKELETESNYIIFQSIDDDLRPTNFCYGIGSKCIICFQYGDNLPTDFEIIPFRGRVKAVNLKEYPADPIDRAMIEIKLDTEIISIKTDLPILNPMVRKVCFRIAGSLA